MTTANILLVDDDSDVLDALALHLKAAGFCLDTANSAHQALEKLEQNCPEMIIADVRMPGMSGYELCRLVRSRGHDELPFLFCSALGSPPERIAGLRMGADDYVLKPADPEELVLKARVLLERSRRLRALREATAQHSETVLAGKLGEIAVADVFQVLDFFGLSDVCLHLETDNAAGQVYLAHRIVVHAQTGSLTGHRAFFRMLAWTTGRFRVEPGHPSGPPSMEGRVESCLLEGLAQLDEVRRLRASLAPDGGQLEICYGPELLSRHFEEKAAQVLGLVETHHDLDRVLELSPLDDLETLRIVSELLQTGALTPRPGARGQSRGAAA